MYSVLCVCVCVEKCMYVQCVYVETVCTVVCIKRNVCGVYVEEWYVYV